MNQWHTLQFIYCQLKTKKGYKMKKYILGTLVIIVSNLALAVGPAGALLPEEILPTQKAYIETMSKLTPTGDVKIEMLADKSKLPDTLTSKNCDRVIMSRSGTILKVTVPISGGEVVLHFGDIDGDANYPVLCL